MIKYRSYSTCIHYIRLYGIVWLVWSVLWKLWGVGEFLKFILRVPKSPHSLNLAFENCHGISLFIQCLRKIDFDMDSICHLLVVLLNYIT